jgi:RNA polymerase sigma-70 factor (ECF subfamily)
MLEFQRGDTSAFDGLVRKYHVQVINIIYRFLGRSDMAEDLAQDVFMRIYRAAPKYQPTAKFSTWVYRIVANHCLNYRRDAGRNPSIPASALEGSERRSLEIPVEVDPSKGLQAGELRTVVKAALRLLPPKQRMAIVLDKYEGMSHREIGAVMKCSEKAVKSLLARARGNLRRLLGRHIS